MWQPKTHKKTFQKKRKNKSLNHSYPFLPTLSWLKPQNKEIQNWTKALHYARNEVETIDNLLSSNSHCFFMFMGRSIPSAQNLQQFARVIASPKNGPPRHAQLKPTSSARPISSPDPTDPIPGSRKLKGTTRRMEAAENSERQRRTPLGDVVSDCVRRWFQDTLKEAKNGDVAMQVLVGQMYTSGYGVGKDAQKVFDAFLDCLRFDLSVILW